MDLGKLSEVWKWKQKRKWRIFCPFRIKAVSLVFRTEWADNGNLTGGRLGIIAIPFMAYHRIIM